MKDIIGTVTTKHGLVHAVDWLDSTIVIFDAEEAESFAQEKATPMTTRCRRRYEKSLLDNPRRVVTCFWCSVGVRWPQNVAERAVLVADASDVVKKED